MIATHPSPRKRARPHDDFLEIMPIIQCHARICFRHLPYVDREEAVAEAVAAALVSFVSLRRRGKNPQEFPSKMATRAVQHVRNDRHVGSRSKSTDVLSFKARIRHGYDIVRMLPDVLQEAVVDNTQTPVPQQVAFRCDVPAWLNTLSRRDRKIAILLAQGHATRDVADSYDLTPGRISQLRRELCDSWYRFHERRKR